MYFYKAFCSILKMIFQGFDIRITPTVDFKEFEDKIKKWCAEAGDDVKYEFIQVGFYSFLYILFQR